jgi:Zn-finger nucleic acid-binding protein
LVAVPYKGIEIDKCSRCQGIWLDCGELEHVVEGEEGFLASMKRIFT